MFGGKSSERSIEQCDSETTTTERTLGDHHGGEKIEDETFLMFIFSYVVALARISPTDGRIRFMHSRSISIILAFGKFVRTCFEIGIEFFFIARELVIIGGVAVGEQTRVLRQGVDIIVATPGRLDELIGGGEIDLSHMRFFILDEAVTSRNSSDLLTLTLSGWLIDPRIQRFDYEIAQSDAERYLGWQTFANDRLFGQRCTISK